MSTPSVSSNTVPAMQPDAAASVAVGVGAPNPAAPLVPQHDVVFHSTIAPAADAPVGSVPAAAAPELLVVQAPARQNVEPVRPGVLARCLRSICSLPMAFLAGLWRILTFWRRHEEPPVERSMPEQGRELREMPKSGSSAAAGMPKLETTAEQESQEASDIEAEEEEAVEAAIVAGARRSDTVNILESQMKHAFHVVKMTALQQAALLERDFKKIFMLRADRIDGNEPLMKAFEGVYTKDQAKDFNKEVKECQPEHAQMPQFKNFELIVVTLFTNDDSRLVADFDAFALQKENPQDPGKNNRLEPKRTYTKCSSEAEFNTTFMKYKELYDKFHEEHDYSMKIKPTSSAPANQQPEAGSANAASNNDEAEHEEDVEESS